MNKTTPAKASIAGLEYLAESFGKVLKAIDASPKAVEDLDDHVVLAADAWAGGENVTIRAEAKRRHDRYAEAARRFAAGDQGELVPVLAERTRH